MPKLILAKPHSYSYLLIFFIMNYFKTLFNLISYLNKMHRIKAVLMRILDIIYFYNDFKLELLLKLSQLHMVVENKTCLNWFLVLIV